MIQFLFLFNIFKSINCQHLKFRKSVNDPKTLELKPLHQKKLMQKKIEGTGINAKTKWNQNRLNQIMRKNVNYYKDPMEVSKPWNQKKVERTSISENRK